MKISFDFPAHLESQTSLYTEHTPLGALAFLSERFPGRTLFATNFSVEDQVITDLIFTNNLPVRVFTRAGNDKNAQLREAVDRYSGEIELWTYQSELAAAEFALKHPERSAAFNENSPTAPLGQLLQSSHLLITGLRASNLASRNNRALFEWDETNRKFRFHPLFYWTDEQVTDYALENNIDPQELLIPDATAREKEQTSPRPGPARVSLLNRPARRFFPGQTADGPAAPRRQDGL